VRDASLVPQLVDRVRLAAGQALQLRRFHEEAEYVGRLQLGRLHRLEPLEGLGLECPGHRGVPLAHRPAGLFLRLPVLLIKVPVPSLGPGLPAVRGRPLVPPAGRLLCPFLARLLPVGFEHTPGWPQVAEHREGGERLARLARLALPEQGTVWSRLCLGPLRVPAHGLPSPSWCLSACIIPPLPRSGDRGRPRASSGCQVSTAPWLTRRRGHSAPSSPPT
jgi:hypothetical protein